MRRTFRYKPKGSSAARSDDAHVQQPYTQTHSPANTHVYAAPVDVAPVAVAPAPVNAAPALAPAPAGAVIVPRRQRRRAGRSTAVATSAGGMAVQAPDRKSTRLNS